jgi:hypothetical protein
MPTASVLKYIKVVALAHINKQFIGPLGEYRLNLLIL